MKVRVIVISSEWLNQAENRRQTAKKKTLRTRSWLLYVLLCNEKEQWTIKDIKCSQGHDHVFMLTNTS